MSRSDDQRVADMLMAANEIATVVERGRSAFDEDVVLRPAMERSREIAGGAAKSLSSDFARSNPAIPVPDLAQVRDRISHHDHRIDPAQLWTIATIDIPTPTTHLPTLASDEAGHE